MKKTKLISCLIIVTLFSCSSDDEPSNSASVVESTIRSGTWRITRFEDSGNNETAAFDGYDFAFEASGTLTATTASNIFVGSWSLTDDSSRDDNSDDLHFNINFDLNNSFDELNDDWHFVSHSASKLELIDVSGGNGGTDYLTFERN